MDRQPTAGIPPPFTTYERQARCAYPLQTLRYPSCRFAGRPSKAPQSMPLHHSEGLLD